MTRPHRRRLSMLIAALVAVALAAAGAALLNADARAGEVSGATTSDAQPGRVLTFGHSYVAGLGATRPDRTWAARVAKRTCRPLENRASSSDLSADTENRVLLTALAQPGSDASVRPGDVAVVETGINDVRLFGPDGGLRDRYGQHLRDILTHLRVTGTEQPIPVVLVADPGIAESAWRQYAPYDRGSQNAADAYAETVKSIARDFPNATVVDIRSSWSADDIAADGVHPNDRGHALIADAVASALHDRHLDRCRLVTDIEITGPDTIERPYASVGFTAEFAPEHSFQQARWTVTEPDGSSTNKAAIDDDGMLTVNHRDGDVLVTATAADGGGAHASKLVHIDLDMQLVRGNAARWPGVDIRASSEYSSQFRAANVADNLLAGAGDWASFGEQDPWIELGWDAPIRADAVVLYDRPGIDDAHGGTLTFSDGSTIEVGDVPPNGDPKTVEFDTRTFTSLRFQVQGGAGPNVGLAELEVRAFPSVPEAPRNVAATAGSSQATVTWDAPAFDGGTPVTGYVVTPYRDGVALEPVTVDADGTRVVVPDLAAGQPHRFTVAARNVMGTGPESAPTEPVVPVTGPTTDAGQR